MLNDVQPVSGGLLISEPFMLDPNFRRSVVLLTEHNEEGSVGYVLNQRSNLYLGNIITECHDSEFPVYFGGPVGTDALHFIHRCYDRMESGVDIGNGIYWGGNFSVLKLLIASHQIKEDEVRFFIGYSGWGIGQLQEELEQNSWLVTSSYSPDTLFNGEESSLWKDLVKGMGTRFAHIANFPDSPQWN